MDLDPGHGSMGALMLLENLEKNTRSSREHLQETMFL
jgi:hypothetical protein